jgi:RNase P subunit RPR2
MGTKNAKQPHYVKATELAEKERYCPECGELQATFSFECFVEDGCGGHPRLRYSCEDCGLIRHFALEVA